MKYALAAISLVGAAVAVPYAGEPEPSWETWTTTTSSTTAEWKPWTTTTTEYKTWETYAPPPPKCSSISTEYCTVYDDENNKWGNYHVETKYHTEYPETCTTEWATWSTEEAPKPTWAPVPVPEKEKCYYTTTYTTEECGEDKSKWDNCKVYTKTETKETDTCTTEWATWSTTEEYVAPTTWATWTPYETPAASTEWATYKASSTVPAPVAKWTGAANKANIAGGLAGVAGLAALLL